MVANIRLAASATCHGVNIKFPISAGNSSNTIQLYHFLKKEEKIAASQIQTSELYNPEITVSRVIFRIFNMV
jgi:hypothetical protein